MKVNRTKIFYFFKIKNIIIEYLEISGNDSIKDF